MGETKDSILQQCSVFLADGQQYDLNYPIASLIYLNRQHNIDLIAQVAGPGIPTDKDGNSIETPDQRTAREKHGEERRQFLLRNVDTLIMAGLVNDEAKSTIPGSLVRRLPINKLPNLVNQIWNAIIRDIAPEKEKTEVTADPNPPDAALTA